MDQIFALFTLILPTRYLCGTSKYLRESPLYNTLLPFLFHCPFDWNVNLHPV